MSCRDTPILPNWCGCRKNRATWVPGVFVREWMEPITEARRRPLGYAGRAEAASPATGALKRHQQEQQAIVDTAFASTVPSKPKRVRVVAKRKR